MEQKPPYEVRTKAPIIPLQARNWPRWYCPRCQAKHYLEIDVLPAVLRLTCSSCKAKWNFLITVQNATVKRTPRRYAPRESVPARPSEDDIVTDYDGGETLAEDAQDVVE